MNINVFDTVDEVLAAIAGYFVEIAGQSIADHGQFSVALSGGSSPKKLYELLASAAYRDQVEWGKVHFFFGDERYVPLDHKDSNYLMAKKALFEPLELRASQVFPVDTSLTPPSAAAEKYTNDIRHYFAGEDIRFDLVLLGLGDNSHTASLFPHTSVLHDQSISVKDVYLEDQKVDRITMTAPMINNASNIAYLVYGGGKAEAVHHVIKDKTNVDEYPAQLIKASDGHLQWFLDAAAAANL
jgi:6-phosphogluconolactonase